jgi:hypothetical protein
LPHVQRFLIWLRSWRKQMARGSSVSGRDDEGMSVAAVMTLCGTSASEGMPPGDCIVITRVFVVVFVAAAACSIVLLRRYIGRSVGWQ